MRISTCEFNKEVVGGNGCVAQCIIMTSFLETTAFLTPGDDACANFDSYAPGAIDSFDLLALIKLYVSTNRPPYYRRALTKCECDSENRFSIKHLDMLYYIFYIFPVILLFDVTSQIGFYN